MRARLWSLTGTAILALVACAIAWRLVAMRSDAQAYPLPEAAAPVEAVQETLPETLPSMERPHVYYEAIEQRPLFSPSRLPLAVNAPFAETGSEVNSTEVTEQVPEAITFQILGVMESQGVRQALISVGQHIPEWKKVPERLPGNWKIQEIGSDWISVSRGDTIQRLELYR